MAEMTEEKKAEIFIEYAKFVNMVDDFFEYSYSSYTKNDIKAHFYTELEKLTKKVKEIDGKHKL